MRKGLLAVAAAVVVAVTVVAPASANHGPMTDHLPPTSANVDLVGKLKLSNMVPEFVADVATYRDTAYLAAWNIKCPQPGGFWSVDISDPRNPRELGFVSSPPATYLTEGMHALRLTTPTFTGDVLAVSMEPCTGQTAGRGGMALYDVTNPAAPTLISMAADTGVRANGNSAHSIFAWDVGDKAYAVLADNNELEDLDIFDITDPRNPVLIKETGLADWPAAQDSQSAGIGPFIAGSFVHDMIVRRVEGQWQMLVSYWDAGYVVLNVDNPANPVYLKDSDFPATDPLTGATPPEGDAHEAEWDRCPEEGVRSRFPCGDVRYIIAADEDFAPYRLNAGIPSGQFAGQQDLATQAPAAPPVSPASPLAGPTVYVGLACNPARPADAIGPGSGPIVPPAPSPNHIAVAQRGTCTFETKYRNIENAGYAGGIVFNSTATGNGCESRVSMGVDPGHRVPFLFVSRSHGFRILNISGYDPANCRSGPNPSPPAVGTAGSDVRVSADFDGWGYMHLLNADTMENIDHFAIPEAINPQFATGFGTLSVHEVTTDPTGDVGYVAWYSAGFRVVDYSGGELKEVGRFIDTAGNDIWGVELNVRRDGRLFALASDRDYGLYIFRFGTDLQNRPRIASTGRVARTMTLSAAVRNDGTITETNTRWTARLPRGLRAVGVTPSQGSCRISGRTVTCNLGTLVENARARVLVRVRATTPGTKRITTMINGRKTEYDVGNNEARVTTRIRAAGTAGTDLTGRP